MSIHEERMRLALQEARRAFEEGEVPVGAVMTCRDEVVAVAHNMREQSGDPTAHAEMLVIRETARALGKRRLHECTLYVTLEPCPMCAGALSMACVQRCYFGARDERQGCGESVYALTQEPSFFHRLPCIGGLLEDEAQILLTRFFECKRSQDKGV